MVQESHGLNTGVKDFLLWWNYSFPKDYLYRQQFNIGFGSPEHRALNQIDVYLHFAEEKLFKEAMEQRQLRKSLQEKWANGVWRKEWTNSDKDLFDKIKI